MPSDGIGWKMRICIMGMLILGSYNTLNNKWAYDTCVPTLQPTGDSKNSPCPEGQRHFNKPWTLNLVMFIGEFSLLLVYHVQLFYKRNVRGYSDNALARLQQRQQQGPRFTVFAIPATCDVLGSGTGAVALLVRFCLFVFLFPLRSRNSNSEKRPRRRRPGKTFPRGA